MTDAIETARSDLAFMRGLALEARDSPDRGGALLAAAGAIFAVASLVFYFEADGLDLPGTGLVWLVALAVYAVVATVIARRLRGQPGATAPRRTTGVVWIAVGATILVIFVVLTIAAQRSGQQIVFTVFAPVILALYGLGWSVAATLSSTRWPAGVAVTAFASALVLAWFVGTAEQYLVYAAALVATALLPGLALMRRARTAAA